MAIIAAVAVDKATPQFDREYSYLVPDGLPVQVGCRVTVPFGRGNRRRLGLVLSLSESEDTARLKKIASLVDRQPLLGEEQLGLMRWLREHTFCSWFDGVRVLIPAGLGMDLEDQFLAEPGAELPPDAPRGADRLLEAVRAGQGKTPEQLAADYERKLHAARVAQNGNYYGLKGMAGDLPLEVCLWTFDGMHGVASIVGRTGHPALQGIVDSLEFYK